MRAMPALTAFLALGVAMEEKGGRNMRRRTIAVVVVVAALFILGYGWWRYHFPYGYSHCCDLGLSGALHEYAIGHGGAFPAGEATPEASLSLLYREKIDGGPLADANLLRGKTVPESVVKEILERGELLTPDTCGWHYVEGLRIDDDPVGPVLGQGWAGPQRRANGGRRPHCFIRAAYGAKVHPRGRVGEVPRRTRKAACRKETAIHHDAKVQIGKDTVSVQARVVGDYIYGSAWGRETMTREGIATLKEQASGNQSLPVIPIEEIRNAKVVVEQDKSRVRFVLEDREIVYDRSGFHVEASGRRTNRGGLSKELGSTLLVDDCLRWGVGGARRGTGRESRDGGNNPVCLWRLSDRLGRR